MSSKIVCIGNRFVRSDSLGPSVFEWLKNAGVPEDVALVDGGTLGLKLLNEIDGVRRVVFVDAIAGSESPGLISVMPAVEVMASASMADSHGAGVGHLVRMAEALREGSVSDWVVVGAEGDPNPDLVMRVAERAVREVVKAVEGSPG